MWMLEWLENSGLGLWVRESEWGYPIVLTLHSLGMAAVVGVCLMHSFRVLGYAPSFPLERFDRLLGVAWLGFIVNAISGVVLFAGEPRRMIVTLAFQVKMLLIVLAGFAVWKLGQALADERRRSDPDFIPPGARTAAIFSIVFWIGAIVAGRLIGYTISPPPPPA